jgi:hypothetical protein
MITGSLFLLPYLSTTAQELRLGIEYDKSVVPKLTVESKAQMRKNLNLSPGIYAIIQAGMSYELLKGISLSGTLRYSTATGESDEENIDEINEKIRYTADLKLKTRQFKNDITLKNRLRYQHSAILNENDKDYIRDKFSVEYRLTRVMQPYVAFEPYFILTQKKIRKLRIYLGSDLELFNNEFELCFILESKFKNEEVFVHHKIGIFYMF